MKNIEVIYQIVREGVYPPIYKRYGDAGFDLRCGKHFYLKPGGNSVPCGTKFKIPFGYEGQIRTRSGNSLNGIPAVTVEQFFAKCGVNFTSWAAQPNRCNGGSIYDAIEKFIDEHSEVMFSEDELIRMDTTKVRIDLGTVDSNFRGEPGTIVINNSGTLYIIPRNARISQMVIAEKPEVTLKSGIVENDTDRAGNGFSSSGLM